jgi:hypothetical protein
MRSNGPLDCDAHFELQPAASGTRLTLSGTLRIKGFWRLLEPFLARDIKKETREEMEALLRLLERAPSSIGHLAASQS